MTEPRALPRSGVFLRDALTARFARGWYFGAFVSLIFAVGFGLLPLIFAKPVPIAVLLSVDLLLFMIGFMVAVPIMQAWPVRRRWIVPAGILVLAAPFLVVFGSAATGWLVYPAVAIAMMGIRRRWMVTGILALTALALAINLMWPLKDLEPWTIPLIIVSVGLLMMSFATNLRTMRELRATQEELARVAVEEERNRVGRDMHDILGHSLSAIALKADLAATLSGRDADAAAREIREVQTLARSTLDDMRAVVSGYRQVRVASELASLRTLLPAAGVTAHLPTTTDDVPESNRELFGWVLREAGTNIVRHSGATACWVSLNPHRIRVEDDGTGPNPDDVPGTGLAGLGDRARDAGGSLTIGRSSHGGFLVEVSA
ncbi:sensor histidine kinase [Microbacterium gorillae]|uniref:sensor histidine kinase n=1 Tax=Microbacterium gorillae TaxID=1231063 RepID=UPI0006931EBA|nr:histidine kinase [Microbacterium gorillae]